MRQVKARKKPKCKFKVGDFVCTLRDEQLSTGDFLPAGSIGEVFAVEWYREWDISVVFDVEFKSRPGQLIKLPYYEQQLEHEKIYNSPLNKALK